MSAGQRSDDGQPTSSTSDELLRLDPDDPRTPSQQIANALRATILTGRYTAGQRLPSQPELARRFGVARETVKAALRTLSRERLVVSRQGSGVFVRFNSEPALDLQSFLRSAFDRSHVSIDYAGFSAEALANTLLPTLDEVSAGRLSISTLRLRVLIVDPATSALPRPVDDRTDDRAIRDAIARIVHDATSRLADSVDEVAKLGLVRSATIEFRAYGLGPVCKLYLVNGERALFGFYPMTDYSLSVDGESVSLIYPSGWDATLFGDDASREPVTYGPSFVRQAGAWFESIWTTVATTYEP